MNKIKGLILVLLLLITSFTLIHYINTTSSPDLSESSDAPVERSEMVQTHTEPQLSSDANFPSPVIQLQQVVAHGLVTAENPNLPLLQGELEDFSQRNIDNKQHPLPNELVELKKRLEKLQSQ
ncbi:hypothetical protein [Vibrio sp. TRT 17S01]|uniref:hypothetical protein n=1 Tax=Vibrio sp. TRT 17S01 TaxID=3418505 RepID=UPI003CF177D2